MKDPVLSRTRSSHLIHFKSTAPLVLSPRLRFSSPYYSASLKSGSGDLSLVTVVSSLRTERNRLAPFVSLRCVH